MSKSKKQRWVRYLVECVLIFISVLGAFLFDNAREKRQLKEKELNLLRDVTTDLINDTIQYNARIRQATDQRNEMSGVIASLESTRTSDGSNIEISFKPFEMVLNKTTYDVIKSTGGFEFISDKALVNGLSEYYNSRAYISDTYMRLISEIDNEFSKILIDQVKFIDNKNPKPSYITFTHAIDQKSLAKLHGNQKVINLLYLRRTFLDQLIMVLTNFLKPKSKKLHEQCETYLEEK